MNHLHKYLLYFKNNFHDEIQLLCGIYKKNRVQMRKYHSLKIKDYFSLISLLYSSRKRRKTVKIY